MSSARRRRVADCVRMAAWSVVPATALLLSPSANAAHVYWTGTQSADWNDPQNWSGGAVPTSADTIYLTTHDQAGGALSFLPTNMNLSGAQLDNVVFTGSTALAVGGNSLMLDRLATRSTRGLTYASGSDLITVSTSTGGTAGLQIGMSVPSGSGVAAGATVAEIIDATTFRLSSATTAGASNRSGNFEARASMTWNGDLELANPSENWTVAGSQTLTVNGNISGIGSIANSYGESAGTLELKGTNSYSGRTVFNTGTVRFFGGQSVSPATTIGLSWNKVRLLSESGAGDFAYTLGNQFENDNSSGTTAIGAGGRVIFTGDFVEKPTANVRGLKFELDGSGAATVELKGTVNQDGAFAPASDVLVRLHNPIAQAYAGNSDITNTTNASQLDGTLDLMGNDYDRKVSYSNRSGMSGAGGLVNSALATPSTASGVFANLGTNLGSVDFGGPGTVIVTGDMRVNSTSSSGTGLTKVGPGATILRSANFYDVTPANNNPNEIWNGTVVVDNTVHNGAKLTSDGLTLGNGRLVVLGNASAATTVTAGTLTLRGTSDRGFAEIDVRDNGGGAAFNFTTIAEAGDTEPLNFQVDRGTGGDATIGSTQAAGKLAPSITFNRNQWATATGTAIVGADADLVAADAATFESSSGFTQDIDVAGSFETGTLTRARTLRFTQSAGNTLTLNGNLELNKSAAAGSGIMVTAGTGAVTINGTGAIDIGVNTGLTIHHNGSELLQIDNRIAGASGADLSKTGTGEVVLGNASSNYGFASAVSPAVHIYEGTLTLAAMANTGQNSPIGTNGIVVIGSKNEIDYATGVATQQPARLRYTGSGHETDRVIQLVGVSEIEANGSGLLHFTKVGDAVTSIGGTGNWNDLILSGSGAGQFDGAIKLGHGSLVKRGAGTWTLGSSSSVVTYGRLLVEEGELVNDGSIYLHTDVVVSGTGRMAGSGTYTGAVTITSTGAISPGSSAGILTTGSVDLAGALIAEILGPVAGTGYDQLAVNGAVSLGSTSDLQLLVGEVPDDGTQYTLILNDGTEAITGAFATANGVPIVDSMFSADGLLWSLNYAGGDGNDLVAVVTVPEPGIAGLAAATTAAWALRRRRHA